MPQVDAGVSGWLPPPELVTDITLKVPSQVTPLLRQNWR